MLPSRPALLLLSLALPGCGAYLGEFPTQPAQACVEASQWQIAGFNGSEVAGGAVQIVVGESHELRAVPTGGNYQDCDVAVASVRWTSTNPGVASLESGARIAWLTAWRIGETEVRAEVTLATGQTHPALLSVWAPSTGQSAHTIRVVAPPPPPAGRRVIFSGTARLDPNPGAFSGPAALRQPFEVPANGTIDIVVDWQSTSNHVIAHLCPGVVPENLGCSTVIDGNLTDGEKPSTGSARVSAGTYSFWITNMGPSRETVTYEAGLVAR